MSSYVVEKYLPETLIDVPECHPISHYRGSLGAVAVRLTQREGMLPYLMDEGVVRRDVLLNDEMIGDFNLKYDYEKSVIGVDAIYLRDYLSRGIGKALYLSTLELPLPSGESPREAGFYLESSHQSDRARRVWEGLVRKGIAQRGSNGPRHYIMR